MIHIINEKGWTTTLDEELSHVKEPKKITRANRKEWLKTKPLWFRKIMNIKSETRMKEIDQSKIVGEF